MELKIASRSFHLTLTYLFIALCAVLFFWMNYQMHQTARKEGSFAASIAPAPLLRALAFDDSPEMEAVEQFIEKHDLKSYETFEQLPLQEQKELRAIDTLPSWRGFYDLYLKWLQGEPTDLTQVPLFHSIRQGEIWRLVTPTFLHYNFFHILFNMAWLWMLGKQIENRLGKCKFLIITLMIALITNVMQYLVTGPLFLGYSGVVVGMAGFIWVRQKVAPWEGYPLPKTTALFLLIFVLAILVLEGIAFVLQITHVIGSGPNIANTAHIVGGIVGMLLAKIPFFARKVA